jgi:hypothetical protein
MVAVHKRILLTAALVGAFAAGCDTPASPDSAATSPDPVITITSSRPDGSSPPLGEQPLTSSTPTSQDEGPAHPEGPIPGTLAGSIAQAWAEHYHAKILSHVVLGVHRRELTVDFPEVHAKLAMNVGNQGADSEPADGIYCVVQDPSLAPAAFITMSRKAVKQLIADCPGPALNSGEAKQVVDFVVSHEKPDQSVPCSLPGLGGQCRSSDHRINLPRFQVVILTSPRTISLSLVGLKAGD